MNHPNKELMEQAINIAKESFQKNGNAVGALIVKGGVVIASGGTSVKVDNDATCHGEINAIRMASEKLGSRYLEDCYLYTTFEPCPMCTSAAIWAKMKGIVYGASREDATPQEHWRVMISSAEVIKHGTPQLELHEEFMREACKELLHLAK